MWLINGETMEDIFKAKADMALGTPKEVFFSAARMVALMPAVDAVPVVRCRDCTHFYTDEYGFPACAESEAMLSPEEDDYCSRGQRRDSSADVRNMPEEVK